MNGNELPSVVERPVNRTVIHRDQKIVHGIDFEKASDCMLVDDVAYRNGLAIPRVTEVLVSASIVDPQWFTEESCWRGSAVHLTCQLYDENDLNDDEIDPGLVPYLDAYKLFRRETCFVPEQIERRKIQAQYRFTGQPDRVGKVFMGGARAVIDLKSGQISAAAAIQTAAYFELTGAPERFAVQLRPDGTYRMEQYPIRDLQRDLAVFHSALNIHNWKRSQNA
jgi:hypothetical protein